MTNEEYIRNLPLEELLLKFNVSDCLDCLIEDTKECNKIAKEVANELSVDEDKVRCYDVLLNWAKRDRKEQNNDK